MKRSAVKLIFPVSFGSIVVWENFFKKSKLIEIWNVVEQFEYVEVDGDFRFFLVQTRNTLFELIWSKNSNIISLRGNLIPRLF